jgi:hypothetical protein
MNRDLIIDALRELSDADYQERVWLGGSTTEMSSLTEAASSLFDDSGLDAVLQNGQRAFSPVMDAQLRELQSLLRWSLDQEAQHGLRSLFVSDQWRLVREKSGGLYRQLI